MKISKGDRVRLERRVEVSEWNLPAHLDGQVVEVVQIFKDGTHVVRLNGDDVAVPSSAIGEVVGSGIGKAEMERDFLT